VRRVRNVISIDRTNIAIMNRCRLTFVVTLTVWLLAWPRLVASLRIPDDGDTSHKDSTTLPDDQLPVHHAATERWLLATNTPEQRAQCPNEDTCQILFFKGTRMHKKRVKGRLCVQGCMIASSRFYLQRGWQCGYCRTSKTNQYLPLQLPAWYPRSRSRHRHQWSIAINDCVNDKVATRVDDAHDRIRTIVPNESPVVATIPPAPRQRRRPQYNHRTIGRLTLPKKGSAMDGSWQVATEWSRVGGGSNSGYLDNL
jgi:hypothetical protein